MKVSLPPMTHKFTCGGIAVASFLFLDKLGDTVVEEWCSALGIAVASFLFLDKLGIQL